MVILAVISIGLVGYFWITNEYERFQKEKIALKEKYFTSQKNLIKNETENVIDYIAFKKSQVEERIKGLQRAGVIPSAQYRDDLIDQIKSEILARIETIHFGDGGYIFAGRWDGLSLSQPAKGRNMIDVTDANGVKIVQELIKVARSGGGYVSYVMPKFDSNITFEKLSYTLPIPEWQWYVGAGVNVNKIETVLQEKRAALQKRVKNHFLKIVAILAAVLLFVLLAAKLVSDRTKKSFDLFANFFSKSATESAKIEADALPFREFESLARAANRMVQERNKAEAALRESEKNYRELVQSVNSIIIRMDTQGRVTFFNTYAQNFFGYPEEKIIGKHVIGTIVPERDITGFDLAEMIKDIGIHPERYVANENENIRCNGERVRVTWMNKAIYDEAGNVTEILCVGIDVTEKWQLEKRLAQAQKMEARRRHRSRFQQYPIGHCWIYRTVAH